MILTVVLGFLPSDASCLTCPQQGKTVGGHVSQLQDPWTTNAQLGQFSAGSPRSGLAPPWCTPHHHLGAPPSQLVKWVQAKLDPSLLTPGFHHKRLFLGGRGREKGGMFPACPLCQQYPNLPGHFNPPCLMEPKPAQASLPRGR
jgi:hypothetical protein